MSATRLYDWYKSKWETTKPIRGRAVDVRPLDNRRRSRDWETVEKLHEDGQEVYACRLYQTNVVKYYPDGTIGLQVGSWATPLTADFITSHSPFYVCKRYSKLWAYPRGHNAEECYPLPSTENMRMVMGEDGYYKPSKPVVVQKRVVDRTKAKEARAKIKPFIDWARSFNRLSDGWVMHDTRLEFATVRKRQTWGEPTFVYDLPENMVVYHWTGEIACLNTDIYQFLQTCDDKGYISAYLAMCTKDKAISSRLGKTIEIKNEADDTIGQGKLFDQQFKWETLERVIYSICSNATDVTKVIDIETTKPVSNVV